MKDYTEFVNILRMEAASQRVAFSKYLIASELDEAADAIIWLMAEVRRLKSESETWEILRKDADRIREGFMQKETDLIRKNMKLEAENAELREAQRKLCKFKAYFDDLYGQGLEVTNWHMNDATEPFDSFFDSAIECMLPDPPQKG